MAMKYIREQLYCRATLRPSFVILVSRAVGGTKGEMEPALWCTLIVIGMGAVDHLPVKHQQVRLAVVVLLAAVLVIGFPAIGGCFFLTYFMGVSVGLQRKRVTGSDSYGPPLWGQVNFDNGPAAPPPSPPSLRRSTPAYTSSADAPWPRSPTAQASEEPHPKRESTHEWLMRRACVTAVSDVLTGPVPATDDINLTEPKRRVVIGNSEVANGPGWVERTTWS
jgi:hypothetical protein